MTDSIETRLETIDERLDRLTAIMESMANVEENTRRRVQQHDHELDDHDERMERLERILEGQDAQLAELKESRADMKAMLEILVSRTIGGTGGETNE